MSYIDLNPPAWTPFYRTASPARPTKVRAQQCARENGVSYADAKAMLERIAGQEIWINSRYQVNVDRDPPHGFGPDTPIVHLSIKRLDKIAIHDWRDLQRLKNELLGPEIEAIEIYPAESRLVDTSNQYHLWAFPAGRTVPIGWTDRAIVSEAHAGGPGRFAQRAMESTS
jgi:hypothetical protein